MSIERELARKVLSKLKTFALWHITDKDKAATGTLITGMVVNTNHQFTWFRPVIRKVNTTELYYASFVLKLHNDQFEDWTNKSELSFCPSDNIINLKKYCEALHSPINNVQLVD